MGKPSETINRLSELELQYSLLSDDAIRAEALAAIAFLRSLLSEAAFTEEVVVGAKERLFSILDSSRVDGRITAQRLKEQLKQLPVETLESSLLSHLRTVYSGIISWEMGQLLMQVDPHISSKLREFESKGASQSQIHEKQLSFVEGVITGHPQLRSWLNGFLYDRDFSAPFVLNKYDRTYYIYLRTIQSILVGGDPIEQLNISLRVDTVLRRANKTSISQAQEMLNASLGSFRGYGIGTRQELTEAIEAFYGDTGVNEAESKIP